MNRRFPNRLELRTWAHAEAVKWPRPCVILLDGDVGAGKTQLTRWFCEALGVNDVASPTFAIHHRYSGGVDHVDLYRVASDADLESSGFWDLLKGDRLLFVEWANRLPVDVWPKDWTKVFIQLKKAAGEERELSVEIKRP